MEQIINRMAAWYKWGDYCLKAIYEGAMRIILDKEENLYLETSYLQDNLGSRLRSRVLNKLQEVF